LQNFLQFTETLYKEGSVVVPFEAGEFVSGWDWDDKGSGGGIKQQSSAHG
jgi:hypothetical protein